MKQINSTNSFDNFISVCFLISIGILAVNQIIAEGELFSIPNYNIYRMFVMASYLFGIAMIFVHSFQSNMNLSNINILVGFMMLYMIAINLINRIPIVETFISTSWCVAFMAGYCFEKHGVYQKFYKLRILILVAVSFFAIISMYQNFTGNKNAITNIIGVNYIFYFGMPLYLWFASRTQFKTEMYVSILLIAATMISFKRTSILAIGFALAAYFYLKYGKGNSVKMKTTFVYCIILLVIAVLIMNVYTDGRLFSRFLEIESTGGNGREQIWERTWDLFMDSPLIKKLFGHGHDKVISEIRLSAHNDFLEVLYDYGLCFFVMYISFVFKLFGAINFAKKKKMSHYPLFVGFFGLFLVISMFSHALLYTYVAFPLFSLLGALYAKSVADEEIDEIMNYGVISKK